MTDNATPKKVIQVLVAPDGTIVVRKLEHEPHWKTVAVFSSNAMIVGADGHMKRASEASNEEIIAAVEG